MANIQMNYYDGNSYIALYPQTYAKLLIGEDYNLPNFSLYYKYGFEKVNNSNPVYLSLGQYAGEGLTLSCTKAFLGDYTGSGATDKVSLTYGYLMAQLILIAHKTPSYYGSIAVLVSGVGISIISNSSNTPTASTGLAAYNQTKGSCTIEFFNSGASNKTAEQLMNKKNTYYNFMVLGPIKEGFLI